MLSLCSHVGRRVHVFIFERGLGTVALQGQVRPGQGSQRPPMVLHTAPKLRSQAWLSADLRDGTVENSRV